MENRMSDKTVTTWEDGLTAKAVKAVDGKFESANRHVREGDKARMRAARDLRVIHRTYFKGDKARFIAAAEAKFILGSSAAYEYVQAADAERTFAEAIKATGTDVDAIGVRTLAKMDRFTGSADKVAEGMKIIKAEAKRAKADGTACFTNAGLAKTIKAAKPEGENTGTDDDRRVQRIAGKYRDTLRSTVAKIEAILQEHGPRAAIIAAIRQGGEWTAESGPATNLALHALTIEWAAEDKAKAIEAQAIEAKAAQLLADREAAKAAAAVLAPQAKPAAKVTAEAKPATPRRTNRKTTPNVPTDVPAGK